MSRGRVPKSAVLAAVTVLCVAVVAFVAWGRAGAGEPASARDQVSAIEARGIFSPSDALFGDTVTATVEVTLDRRRIEPDSVRVRPDFVPWKSVAAPETIRRDGQSTTYLRTTYVLRCLDRPCLPSPEGSAQEFPKARVTYTAREAGTESGGPGVLEMTWPQLFVGSRYAASAGQGPANAGRWRIDLLSLPTVSYRLRPGLLFALLLVAVGALAIAGGRLARRAFPRRSVPAPDPPGPPEPILTPLERALVLLEDPARVNGAGDQRRALEFVALELVARGDLPLAAAARALAWSEPTPEIGLTSELAARARWAFGEGAHEDLR